VPVSLRSESSVPELAAVSVAPKRARPFAAGVASTKTLGYGSSGRTREDERFSFLNLTDPYRDLYVPLGSYLAGFMAALLWVGTEMHAGTNGLIAMSLAAGALTLIKTVVLICLALVIAPPLGISFGLFWPAILKFAAIIIVTDVGLLWLDTALKASGGISPSGRAPYQIIFVRLGLAATLISCMSYYVFNMDLDEVALFAVPMAFVSWMIGFVLALILLPSFRAAVKPTAWSAANAPIPAVARFPGGAFPVSAPRGITPSVLDQLIVQRIYKDGPSLHEGREWAQSISADKSTRALIEQMYAVGATKVYVDVTVIPLRSGKSHTFLQIYVDQPSTEAERAACQEVERVFRKENGLQPTIPIASTGRFLVIDLLK
jgi:hypothetical protein